MRQPFVSDRDGLRSLEAYREFQAVRVGDGPTICAALAFAMPKTVTGITEMTGTDAHVIVVDADGNMIVISQAVGLQEAEKTMTSPITLDLEGVPLKTTLRLLLTSASRAGLDRISLISAGGSPSAALRRSPPSSRAISNSRRFETTERGISSVMSSVDTHWSRCLIISQAGLVPAALE